MLHRGMVLNMVHDQRTQWERRVLRASEQKNKNSNKTYKKVLFLQINKLLITTHLGL